MTDADPSGQGPLAGLRVLDISTVVAAPFAATLLADYGADVVKAELPGEGDGLRSFPPFKDGKSLWWKVANRGKRFVELDLRTPEGADLFARMIPDFDVVIENFRPGTLERWGLGPDVLMGLNPSLVLLRVTGFGQDGPAANRPGFARLFEAMSGLTHMTGEPDGAPMHAGHPMGDSIGGVFGALSVTTALLSVRSDPQRRGQVIDLSLTEAMFRLLDFQTIGYDQLGRVIERTGNRNQYSAPADVYPTADGRFISLAGSTQATFRANLRAIGREDLNDDPRFSGNAQRVENVEAIDAIFRAWFAAHSQDEAIARFREAGGTLAPILSIDQIFEDPQFQAREAIVAVPDDDFGEVRMQAVVPRFSRSPTRPGRAAGRLGRDTEAVLRPYAPAPDPAREP
ncbi:CoA transferase [uncultured Albimonas sp.]|uniref:CaiB/BaiF CoA transferase family protein n=1 Tax=uncultured Albimonas sp. TaxID=1331701 RepID=UPI0030EC5392|tara:strand:+ start:5745 stop:6941 length:1197 start_codon:yes stop_codon:yes gene_type:complete